MNTRHIGSLDTVAQSPLRILIGTVLQSLHLIPRPVARDVMRDDTAPPAFLYEQAFVTEREARAFAAALLREGYRVEVQQDIYDYSWSVEVFER